MLKQSSVHILEVYLHSIYCFQVSVMIKNLTQALVTLLFVINPHAFKYNVLILNRIILINYKVQRYQTLLKGKWHCLIRCNLGVF